MLSDRNATEAHCQTKEEVRASVSLLADKRPVVCMEGKNK